MTLKNPGRFSLASSHAGERSKYPHLLLCWLPPSLFGLLALGVLGGGYWLLLPSLFLLGVLPLLDFLTGWQDTAYFEKADFSPVEISWLSWSPRLYAVLYLGSLIWLTTNIRRFAPMEAALLVLDLSLLAGVCFAAAHELLHAKARIDQFLQRLTTSVLFYPHYKLIHIRSHHVHVGTDHDENTAWLSEGFYAYLLRTIPGSMQRCWQLEVGHLRGLSAAMHLLRNKMVLYAAGEVTLLVTLYLLSGGWGLLFYLAHIVGAHTVLESVNYIQHYGLLRGRSEGEYEDTGPEHSWDTYHFFSSYATFRVGHHSYHHLAVKPYYLLGTEPKAPTLPVGYLWSIPLVLLPPLWRHVINSRLRALAGSIVPVPAAQ
jgi:alkane 1-monooxygenase